MTLHVHATGTRLVEKLQSVMSGIATDLAAELDDSSSVYHGLARTSTLPQVRLLKRPNGRGREADLLQIEQGVSVVPMKPIQGNSTNERDTVGYRFAVTIVDGTWTDQFNDGWGIGNWEQAFRQQIHNRRLGQLSALTDEGSCELFWTAQPGDLPEWAKLPEGIDSSTLVVTCYIREARL